MRKTDNIKKVIDATSKVVITSHKSPDGDAIGSSMALKGLLENMGVKDVSVIVPDGFPKFLYWLNPNNEILYFDSDTEKAKGKLSEADLIFSLDYNSLSRIGDMGAFIEALNTTKIVVDHHQNPDDFADYYFIDTDCCSTCQLIYELAEDMQVEDKVDSQIGSAIYCGIMTDTGSFRFPSTTSKTHNIIAKLLDAGAEGSQIHQQVYDNNSEDRLRLLGYALTNKMKVYPSKKAAIIYLSKEDLKRYNYQGGDTEGLVNYPLSMDGIKFSVLVKEHNNLVKMSFRSKNEVYVNEFAREHFNGGGHIYAAGGRSDLSFDHTILKLEKLIEEF